jgi:hypothetical protein
MFRFKFDVTSGERLVPSVQIASGGAVVTTSNSTSAHPAAHAIDGSYATYWEASNRNLPFSGERRSGRSPLTNCDARYTFDA